MFCIQCGTQNTNNSEFCSNCGSSLIKKDEMTKSINETNNSTADSDKTLKINKVIKRLNLTLVILLICAGICEVISLYIEIVAMPFATLGMLILIACLVIAIIRTKQIKKIKPPKQKKIKESNKK